MKRDESRGKSVRICRGKASVRGGAQMLSCTALIHFADGIGGKNADFSEGWKSNLKQVVCIESSLTPRISVTKTESRPRGMGTKYPVPFAERDLAEADGGKIDKATAVKAVSADSLK
ncbi:MAG: hypothetical protein ACP5G4_10430 [bacterium]